jgi:cytoskeletal protein CcmA (bactofilin family)
MIGLINQFINRIKEEKYFKETLSTLIGVGDSITSLEKTIQLKSEDSIRIDGLFNGNIISGDTVIVSSTGIVTGNIYGCKIIIAGKVEGNLICTEITRIASTANIHGDIVTKGLVVDTGCIINGKVTTNPETKSTTIE